MVARRCRNSSRPAGKPHSNSTAEPPRYAGIRAVSANAHAPVRQAQFGHERLSRALQRELGDGNPCRSVATHDAFCAYHAALADEAGDAVVANGDHTKKRNARQREPVIAESEPLELSPTASKPPSAVRPALALTAVEELETIRAVLLEAATSTTRESWARCTCLECGRGFRQEISVPDHGARIKAIETSLREGLGRVGEAEVVEPKVPQSVEELRNLSTAELELMVALGYTAQIRAIVDDGDDALRLEVERWEPDARAAVARALAEVA